MGNVFQACGFGRSGNPLIEAIKLGDLNQVVLLLEEMHNSSHAVLDEEGNSITYKTPDQEHMTPLFHAAMRQMTDIMSVLIQAGADPDSRMPGGRNKGVPILFLCIEHNYVESVQTLLDSNADPNITFKNWSPLNHFWRVQKLKNKKYGTEIAEMLLKAGADPNNIAPNMLFPLYAAVDQLQDTEFAKVLLANGANSEQRYKDVTPLFRAVLTNNIDMLDTLVEGGANVNVAGPPTKPIYGGNCLFNECVHGNINMVRALIKHGIDLNAPHPQTAKDHIGRSPIESTLIGPIPHDVAYELIILLKKNGAKVSSVALELPALLKHWTGEDEAKVLKLLDPLAKNEKYEEGVVMEL
jgi:ankyrin repeat protein